MKITEQLLVNWGACSSGKSAFIQKFPEGAEYKEVIAACDEQGERDYRNWIFVRAFQHLDAKEVVEAETDLVPKEIEKGLEPLKALESEDVKNTETISKEDEARLAASGFNSQLAASGRYSRLAASGFNSQLAASGRYSRLAASGDDSQLAASGFNSQLAASGRYSRLAASGRYSQLAASGDDSQLAASGRYSRLAASGFNSQLAASGFNSQLAASGFNSRLAASGDNSRLAASGDDSRLAASGFNSQLAASGRYSQLAASGENSVIASAALGTTFKLGTGGCAAVPYRDENEKIRFATAYVGENIEADTWYQVTPQGEFTKVEV